MPDIEGLYRNLAFIQEVAAEGDERGDAPYFSEFPSPVGSTKVYRTVTVEVGHCADVIQWKDEDPEDLIEIADDFDALDVWLPAARPEIAKRYEEFGFRRQPVALVYMPLHSYDFVCFLAKVQTSLPSLDARWLRGDDIPLLVPLMEELLLLTGRRRTATEIEKLIRERLAQPIWSGGYVLFQDPDAEGFGVLNLYLDQEGGAQIFDFAVSPSARKCGLGRRICAHIGRYLQKYNFHTLSGEVDLENHAALAFWLRGLGGLVHDTQIPMLWSRSF